MHNSQWETSIGEFLPLLIDAAIGAALFFVAFSRAIKRTGLTVNQRLIPLYFWFTPVFIGIAYGYWLERIDRQLNVMSVSIGIDIIISIFDFKGDGRYKYMDGSPLGVFYSYGTYTRTDSIINLTPQSGRNAPIENKFAIRPYLAFKNPCFNKKSILYGLDKDGKYISRGSVYYINQLSDYEPN